MANIKSAEKKNRQRLKRRERNQHHLTTMRTFVKRVRTMLTAKPGKGVVAATKTEIADALKVAITQIDKAAGKGVLARKAASRKISRLTTATPRRPDIRSNLMSATGPRREPRRMTRACVLVLLVLAPACLFKKPHRRAGRMRTPRRHAHGRAPPREAARLFRHRTGSRRGARRAHRGEPRLPLRGTGAMPASRSSAASRAGARHLG